MEDAARIEIMTMLATLSEANVLDAVWKAITTDTLQRILEAVTISKDEESPVVAALDDIQQTLDGMDQRFTRMALSIANLESKLIGPLQ